MTRAGFLSTAVIALTSIAFVGCAEPKVDFEPMEPPPRPAELDRLDVFVGTWEGTAEITVPGSDEVMKTTGRNTTEWRYDKRFLVEDFEADMGDIGAMTGLSLSTWDPQAKKYRTWMFSNWGEASTGTLTYCEKSKTWYWKSQGTNPMTGKMSYGKGQATLVDDNTYEWSWKEWDNALYWGEPMSMKGTSHRTR